jgi:aspartate 1-decarboxylase
VREFLRSKIHNARVTKADLAYEGSFGIDADVLAQVGILPFEAIEIYNVTNGSRLRTYAIELPSGSRRYESNGAAAHHIREGDTVIIAAYTWLDESALQKFTGPRILILDEKNAVKDFYQAPNPTQQPPRKETIQQSPPTAHA